jgi:hypothetical protein
MTTSVKENAVPAARLGTNDHWRQGAPLFALSSKGWAASAFPLKLLVRLINPGGCGGVIIVRVAAGEQYAAIFQARLGHEVARVIDLPGGQ